MSLVAQRGMVTAADTLVAAGYGKRGQSLPAIVLSCWLLVGDCPRFPQPRREVLPRSASRTGAWVWREPTTLLLLSRFIFLSFLFITLSSCTDCGGTVAWRKAMPAKRSARVGESTAQLRTAASSLKASRLVDTSRDARRSHVTRAA